MRRPAARKSRPAVLKRFPAPVKGWIANQNLAIADPQGAATLENWFPTATGIELRNGHQLHCTLDEQTTPVRALFSYKNGPTKKLFAASTVAIYDITTPLAASSLIFETETTDQIVDDLGNFLGASSLGAPAALSQTGGNWVSVQFATPGGVFLRLVNGVDTPLVYDGSTFATSNAITGVTGGANTLSYVWAFKNRLWFIKKGTLDAYYLSVDTLGGAASLFPLGAQFPLGGELLFGASWSLDENSGLSASCVFVTTEGEVAVYQGSDPSSAANWQLKGVYRIGKPLGPNAWMRAGGDIVIATDIGFIPLSQATTKDFAALSPGAVSYPIETAWNKEVSARQNAPWTVKVWPNKQRAIISLPAVQSQRNEMMVANVRTGAWCNYTGLGAAYCMEFFDGRMFFGSEAGEVFEMEVTGSDVGRTYTGIYAPLFDDNKQSGQLKTALMARAVMIAPQQPKERIDFLSDYSISLSPPPDASPQIVNSLWGAGRWGSSAWGQARARNTYQEWQSVAGSGYAVSVGLQVSSGSVAPPDIELVRLELTMDTGDIVS